MRYLAPAFVACLLMGCVSTPAVTTPDGDDNDDDGVANMDDQCPMLAGPEHTRGCPVGDRATPSVSGTVPLTGWQRSIIKPCEQIRIIRDAFLERPASMLDGPPVNGRAPGAMKLSDVTGCWLIAKPGSVSYQCEWRGLAYDDVFGVHVKLLSGTSKCLSELGGYDKGALVNGDGDRIRWTAQRGSDHTITLSQRNGGAERTGVVTWSVDIRP
ncbi:MAG: hypothetical protein ACI9MR_002215 [Myxococcota bacterium]|jgi:hypothetical protein